MVHLRCEPGTKGYRMFDVERQKIVISRDIVFDETRGWSWNIETDHGQNSKETEFSIQTDVVVAVPAAQNLQNSLADPSSSSHSVSDSPLQADGSPTFEFGQQNSPQTNPNSSETGVIGRGPMLPHLQSDTVNPSDPSMAEDETYDDTPPQGWRKLNDVYDLLLAEVQELLLTEEEPKDFQEAAGHEAWELAMEDEIASIERNKTWELTDLPSGHSAIELKWVYKLKRDANGVISRHKARLVAKGYVQQQGIYFDKVFTPVARLETVRLIFALAAQRGWSVHHLDVKIAVLHGELKEEMYVSQPEVFMKQGKERMGYKLSKALYGLKQAPRAWNTKLDSVLKEYGFQQCKLEQAVYTKRMHEGSLLVGIYVDDLIVTGNKLASIIQFKKQMEHKFEMSDLGLLSYYLGLEVTQSNNGITIKQSGYANNILQQSSMWECDSTMFPMDPSLKVSKEEASPDVDATEYRKVIGCIRYLTHTRSDLTHAIGYASRYMKSPKMPHLKAVKQILRYVKGTTNMGI